MKKQKLAPEILENPYAEAPIQYKKRWTRYLPVFVSVVSCLVMLAVIIQFFGTYDKALDNYFSVYIAGKDNRISRLAPREYWNWLETEKGITIDEIREAYQKDFKKVQSDLQKQFGKNVKYTYSIKKDRKLDEGKLEELATDFAVYGIRADAVKDAYRVDLSITYSGKKGSDTKENAGYVVKIGTNWYLFWDEEGGNAEFPVPLDGVLKKDASASGTSADEYNNQFISDELT
ncbi:MAG: hypothetical protein MJ132_03310 [Clostridia bacterium]|nr:hypothetical protein [Clostridia bacterium]